MFLCLNSGGPGTHHVLNKYLLNPSNKQYIISTFHVLVKWYKIRTVLLPKLLSKAWFLSDAQMQNRILVSDYSKPKHN